jgi:hypothetical protein
MLRVFHPITGTQLWFSLFVITFLYAIAIYTWRFRKERGALPHVYVQACRGGWVLALVLASVNTGFGARLFWINTYQILAILLSFLWFRFITQLSGLDRRLPAWLNRAMLVWVGLLWLAILTNAWHGWYWKSTWAEGNVVRTVLGPAAYIALSTAYGMNLVSAAVNVIWAVRCVGLRRTQAWLFLEFSQIVQRSGVIRLIIDNDQLEIWISCFLIDALDAALEQVKSVARGNNERHKWADGKRVFDSPIVTGRGKNPDPEPDAIKMGLKSSSLRLFNIFLFLHRKGSRSGNSSPMIKYMRNVPDMCGWDAFTDAHGEVPVLAALIPYSKPTKLSNNGGTINT